MPARKEGIDMKKKIIIITTMTVCLVHLLSCVAFAMKLDMNSIDEITTSPSHQVNGYQGTFAVSGEVSVWVDGRDSNGIPRVYGVNLTDLNYAEFVVDINAPGCWGLAMSKPLVVYRVYDVNGYEKMRVADITDQNSPVKHEFTPLIPNVSYFDVSGATVVYSGGDPCNDWRDGVYAADVTDPCNIQQYSILLEPTNRSIRGLAIDGAVISWSVENYDANSYVQVADITNPNEPNIVRAELATNIVFDYIDTSGQWLVSHGRSNWQYCIFAVQNYRDVNNWQVQTVWKDGQDGEYYFSGPRLDEPVMVWVVTTRMPALSGGGADPTQDPEQYMLKAAYLTPTGLITTSQLRTSDYRIWGADISGKEVVWSEENASAAIDLYKGALVFECGDWGYMHGDLDRNCEVDFRDFAIFAEDWLKCTTPGEPGCEAGSLGG
jgi:hypothetical protein